MNIGGSAGPIARRLSGGIGGGIRSKTRNITSNPRRYYAPPRYSAPRANSSGRYSRPSAPPSAGSGSIPSIKKPPPGLGQFLGKDSTYQDQVRNFNRSLKNFLSEIKDRSGKLQSEYGLSTKALKDQRGLDLENIEEDYASRGLVRSGVYGEAVGDYEKEYGKRFADLTRANTDARRGLNRESSKYRSQDRLNRQSAKEAAARRRAEKYGL